MFNFQNGSRYSFNTRAPGVLGTKFTNAKCIGIVGYDVAIMVDNVDFTSRAVYPLLPQGSPSDPKGYTYILFIAENGTKTVLAYEWIDDTTIVVNGSATITVTLQDTSADTIPKLRQTLVMLGYKNVTITSV